MSATSMAETERFLRAMALFDQANSEDPRKERAQGVERPYELLRAEQLSEWVTRLDPGASEALRLAARCQHIQRWQSPRSNYPEGRSGYLRWRAELARFHAAKSAELLEAAGYGQETIQAVQRVNLKQGLGRDPDSTTMEDALCLVFLAEELADFSQKHAPEKVVAILRKTWRKMSARGQSVALVLCPALPQSLQALLKAALVEP